MIQERVEGTEEEAEPNLVCPECGFKAATLGGLAGHQWLQHNRPTQKDSYKEYVDGVLEKFEKAWEDFFRARLDAEEKRLEAQNKALENITKVLETLSKVALDTNTLLKSEHECAASLAENLKILGKVIESVGNGVIKSNGSMYWCDADIKGLQRAGIKPTPYTLEHSQEQALRSTRFKHQKVLDSSENVEK